MIITMKYFASSNHIIGMDKNGWGYMDSPATGKKRVLDAGYDWIVDNGAYSGVFDEGRYFRHLGRNVRYLGTNVFAVCPDVMMDKEGTLGMWQTYSQRVRELGYRVGYVLQDGSTPEDIPGNCDAVFVGGSTEWKLSNGADVCIAYAKSKGLWVHIGRVNSRKRFDHFLLTGADSVDGNFLNYGPDINKPKIQAWLKSRTLFNI